MKVENIHGDARASRADHSPWADHCEGGGMRSLHFLISMPDLPPELLQNMQEACRVVEKVRIEDPLHGPIRNGVPAGEGLSSVRLLT
jgi:hypothetical protein